MLSFPDVDLDIEDEQQMADWLEASSLFDDAGGEIAREKVVDVLSDSGLVAPLPKRVRSNSQTISEREAAETCVDRIWRVVTARRLRLGEAYPFDVSANVVTRRRTSWQDSICFSLLLAADIGKSYTGVQSDFLPGSSFCRLFEKVVEACEGLIFRGTTVRFGHPRDIDWPVSVKDRIGEMADRFSLDTDVIEGKIHGRDKDLGLDVASRISFGDEEPGTLIVLTQCATGVNWTSKHEPSLKEWDNLIRWKAQLVRAIAFPWRMRPRELLWREALRLEAILLDRMRLLSGGNPDVRLDPRVKPDVVLWCEQRVREIHAKHIL